MYTLDKKENQRSMTYFMEITVKLQRWGGGGGGGRDKVESRVRGYTRLMKCKREMILIRVDRIAVR